MSNTIEISRTLLGAIDNRKHLKFRSEVTSEEMKKHLDKVSILGGKSGLIDTTILYANKLYTETFIASEPLGGKTGLIDTTILDSNKLYNEPIYLPATDFYEAYNNLDIIDLNQENIIKKVSNILPYNNQTDIIVITELHDKLTLLSNRKFILPSYCRTLFTLTHFKSINLSEVDTQRISVLDNMFYKLIKLEEINIQNIDIHTLKELKNILNKCEAEKIIVNTTSYKRLEKEVAYNKVEADIFKRISSTEEKGK